MYRREQLELGKVLAQSKRKGGDSLSLRSFSNTTKGINSLSFKTITTGQNKNNASYSPGRLLSNGTITSTGSVTITLSGEEVTIATGGTFRGIVTDYIPVISGMPCYFKAVEVSKTAGTLYLGSICFFDINKTFISQVTEGSNLYKGATAPVNAVYARADFLNTSVATSVIKNVEASIGPTALNPYVPFFEFLKL